MKTFILSLFLLLSHMAIAVTELTLSNSVYSNEEETFFSHQGPKRFDSTLAMSVVHAPIIQLRAQIEKALNVKLDCFRLWNPNCEAHVTVVTPVEFFDVLKEKITMDEIEKIADRYEIQHSRLKIQGLGSAFKVVDGVKKEVYFVIVDSDDLRNIRQQIYYEFVRRGGKKEAFDPAWFFPHITVGYIAGDLHESDGILKSIKHTFDSRFNLKTVSDMPKKF